MIQKPTLAYVQALHTLVHSPQWKDIGGHLEIELRETLKHLVGCADPVQVHYLRGRAAVLSELLGQCSETRETLDKLQRQPPANR
jgi:hypothetical protein